MTRAAAGVLVALLVAPARVRSADDDMVEALDRAMQTSLLQGKVCPDPAKPCSDFLPYELSFEITKKFEFDRAEDKSLPFYSAIVVSGELCGIPEEKRLEVQALFPSRKVFVHRHFCDGFRDKVTYTNVDPKIGFVAIYAGEELWEAKKTLAEIKAVGKFRDAYLKKMQVVVKHQLE